MRSFPCASGRAAAIPFTVAAIPLCEARRRRGGLRRIGHLARWMPAGKRPCEINSYCRSHSLHDSDALLRDRALADTATASAFALAQAVGSFEAIASISVFAYEHRTLAPYRSSRQGSIVDAAGPAHPLPASKRVANDVSIGVSPAAVACERFEHVGEEHADARAVGVNVVLALAGSPVCASRLRVSPMIVATAMRQAIRSMRASPPSTRNSPVASDSRMDERPTSGVVSPRRNPTRHQFARSTHRRPGRDQGGSWTAARSAWCPRTIWRSRRLSIDSDQVPRTCTSKISSWTGK